MKQGLEKFVSGTKDVGKKSLKIIKDNVKVGILSVGLLFGGYFIENAKSGNLEILNYDSYSKYADTTRIKSDDRAVEGWDSQDALYIDSFHTDYLKICTLIDSVEASTNVKPINSTTDSYGEMSVVGNPKTRQNWINFIIKNINPDSLWKNLFFELYSVGGINNDPNNLIGVWDIKKKDGQWIPLGEVSGSISGVYSEFRERKFNHADLNRDRKVDFQDWNIFAGNWKREGIEKGSNPNALGDYADISNTYDANGNMIAYGNGSVGIEDLMEFAGEWGWKANDPNTW